DVKELYRLVKERYSASRPEGFDLMLWGDLHTLFEPDKDDEIWKDQHEYNLISWRLCDFCGIHILLMENGLAIHMLTEKKYPLSQEMLTKMLSRKLEVDHESSQAFELLRFIRSQIPHTLWYTYKVSIFVILDSSKVTNTLLRKESIKVWDQQKLIIWDEAPMINMLAYEAFDITLRDICSGNLTHLSGNVFGGKVVVFGGDFRQILPVIPNGSRQDVVHASLNMSYLWKHCTVLKLTQNMRLCVGCNPNDAKEINEFAELILNIGEGKIGGKNNRHAEVEFPKEMAILAATHAQVDKVNERMMSKLPGREKVCYSLDSVSDVDIDFNYEESMYTTEFLNTIRMSGILNHKLVLKIGAPVMCLRNIDQRGGFCNGTRLQIVRMRVTNIEAKIISDDKVATIVDILRMNISPSDKKMTFQLNRR
ncbi:ATP-dependent DNA helicase PIF1-like protein, partial [Tanacetum coccineum]